LRNKNYFSLFTFLFHRRINYDNDPGNGSRDRQQRRHRLSGQVKLKDLARMLGVSVSTVARSLADAPGISTATKARVQRLAREKGYVVHSAARAMRTGHSQLIGLIVPDVRNDFYGTAAMALARRCEDEGFQLLLAAI